MDTRRLAKMTPDEMAAALLTLHPATRLVETAEDLILMSRHLERIGDHATNVAEDVIFILSARDVRHHQADLPRGGLALFEVQVLPHNAGDHRLVRAQRPVAGDIAVVAADDDGLVNVRRLRCGWEFEFEFGEAGFGAHGLGSWVGE